MALAEGIGLGGGGVAGARRGGAEGVVCAIRVDGAELCHG